MELAGEESQGATILVSDLKRVKPIYEADISRGFTRINADKKMRIRGNDSQIRPFSSFALTGTTNRSISSNVLLIRVYPRKSAASICLATFTSAF